MLLDSSDLAVVAVRSREGGRWGPPTDPRPDRQREQDERGARRDDAHRGVAHRGEDDPAAKTPRG